MKKYLRLFRTKKIFVLLVLILVVIIVVFIKNSYKNINLFVWNEDNSKFKEEYESLNGTKSIEGKPYPEVHLDSNKMKYINIGEALNMLENGTGIIYIGYAECIYCRSAVQVLVNTAKDMEIEEISYLDISKIWDIKEVDENNNIVTIQEPDEKYYSLLERLDEEYIENYSLISKEENRIEVENRRIKIPLVLFVINGNIVSSNVGTLFSQEDPYVPLDKDQINGLSEIYQHGIKDVLEELTKDKS